jgi:hypothetical protein
MRGRDKTPRLIDTLARDWLAKRDPTPPGGQPPTQVPTPDPAQGSPGGQPPDTQSHK